MAALHHCPGIRSLCLVVIGLALLAPAPAAATTDDALSWIAGRNLEELGRLFLPGRYDARTRRAVATFLDDQDGGADDRIDAGLETLHLAAYLLRTARASLKPGLSFALELIGSCDTCASTRLARGLEFDVEGADLARKSHHERARWWKNHFATNKKRILEAAALMQRRRRAGARRPVVMVLGAGSCADIPLRELIARGNDVILVDLDSASLKLGVALQVARRDRRHVRLELRDLSEGAVGEVTAAASAIIARHARSPRGAAQARAEIARLFRSQRVSVPRLEGNHRVDLLVSSMLMGQLPVFPVNEIARRFARAFKEPLAKSPELATAQSAFGDKLFDAHIEALIDFVVRDRGVVYFSSDIMLRPTFFEPRSGRRGRGPPSPVVGYHGQPLRDLDTPFLGNPALQVISPSSASGRPGSDLWTWNQEPCEKGPLAPRSTRLPGVRGPVRVRRGFERGVDAVTIIPATRGHE